jgi:hypothetical protein
MSDTVSPSSSGSSQMTHMSTHLAELISDFLTATDRRNGASLIAEMPIERVFSPKEAEIIREEADSIAKCSVGHECGVSNTIVLKVTRLCNLRCFYCGSWR